MEPRRSSWFDPASVRELFMPNTLRDRSLTTLDEALVNTRPKPAKVTTAYKTEAESLSPVVIEAGKKVYGKQEAMAAQLGKDPGNLSRDVNAERTTLAQLRALGPDFLAEFGKGLVEQYGALSTPEHRVKQAIKRADEALDEIRQYVENAS